MTVATFAFLAFGLVLLVAGAEALVRGASRLAAMIGISPLVIGLTIVAFGTSSPELAVSVMSSASGQADIALGNVVGSNIFNVLFILGLAAVITPLIVAQQLIRLDVPIMIGVSVLLLLLGLDGKIGRAEGALLFAGIIAYTIFQIVQARREKNLAVTEEYEHEYAAPTSPNRAVTWGINLALIAVGLVLLVLGSRWLVDSAVQIATALGISQFIIGLTIIAAGTSLPEVATSVIASIRGERDIAVGNVVGSSIFNILAVLGLASVVAPDGVAVSSEAIQFDIPFMTAVALACLPIFFTGNVIARWEGLLFLGYYVAYIAYLVLGASQSPSQETFNMVMLLFVVPLTILTLAIGVWRSWRASQLQAGSQS
jgi:cation:H+ antiporter